jgi:hypothetical protein
MIPIVIQHGSRGVAPRRASRRGAFLSLLTARLTARAGAGAVLAWARAWTPGALGCESMGGGGGASAPVVDRAGLVGNPSKGVVRFAHAGYRDGEEAQLEREIQGLLAQ